MTLTAEPANGHYVTWRELSLKIDPIASQVDALDKKLDAVLIGLSHDDGVKEGQEHARQSIFDSAKFWIGIAATFAAGTIGSIIALIFLKK